MPQAHNCQSCGMSIESGTYCPYCVDATGQLQPFEERFERMLQWLRQREPTLPRADAEQRTREYMRKMPAWRDHPALKAR
ncbi:MAG: hypothetical protein AABY83_06360 [Pseudomonadota bacterium]